MLEGKPPRPHGDGPREEMADGGLRAMSWSELVSRLSAAQDLREAGQGYPIYPDASFDVGSARRIAALRNGEGDVNRDASGNGKGSGGKNLPVVATAQSDGPRR